MIYNKILRYCSRFRALAKKKTQLETGFSMLEAVVVVGVLLALAVGGLFAYGPIVQNAKLAKLKSAASQVYTAATVYQVDGDPATKPQDALDAWNASSTSIKVGFFDTNVVATPAMTTAEGEYLPAEGEDFCIQATDVSKPELEAKSGDCPAPPAEDTKTEVTPLPVPTVPAVETVLLKNGDFSDSLNFWKPKGVMLPTSDNGEAILKSGSDALSSISQIVSIPSTGAVWLQYSYHMDKTDSQNQTYIYVNVYDKAGVLLKKIKTDTAPVTAVPLTRSAVDLTEFAGKSIELELQFQKGPYNAVRSAYLDDVVLQVIKGVPNSPTNVNMTVDDTTTATITWNPPTENYASISQYTVIPYRDGVVQPVLTTTGATPSTTAVLKGLASGSTYTFKVTATNQIGESPQSLPSTPFYVPVKPIINGDFSADLTGWKTTGTMLPTWSNGELLFKSGSNALSSISQTVSVPSTGMQYLQYSYRLDATDSSNQTYIYVNVYDSAGNFIKKIGENSFPITAVSKTPYSINVTEFAGRDIKLEFQFKKGPYNTVRSAYLDDISIDTITEKPSPPRAVGVVFSEVDATISWTKPSSQAASVTNYIVTPYRNGQPLPDIAVNGTPPATTAVLSELNSGSAYSFTVKAVNSFGTSDASEMSESSVKPVKYLENGSFSTDLTGWKTSGAFLPTWSNGEVLLKSGSNGLSNIYQNVSIPSSGITEVKYSYRLDATDSSNQTYINVNVYDSTGKFIKSVAQNSFPVTAVPKAQATNALTEFAGKDIRLEFQFKKGTYTQVRSAYLDDVSIVTR